jgi:DNA/RNA-binding domain of Phe-tRNA-synthetase-like protein
MVNIEVSKTLKEKWQDTAIGCIECDVKVTEFNEELWKVITEKSKEIQDKFELKDVLEIENIKASRNAYKKLGKDPSRYRLSSESLLRRIVKGNELYKVNNVVDINNLVSLETCNSVGSYDLDKVDTDICLTVGMEGETYEGIGRGVINLESLPVFEDKDGKFGSTTSDSPRAMITENSKHILMNIISFNGADKLNEYIDYAKELLEKYADATNIETKIV